ncbi:hypothetical protein CLOM_g23901 [Closterium sp. NIES-68]|nr:hypothetical protein CLOM_g23901 [Closterium sp. NIES-68]
MQLPASPWLRAVLGLSAALALACLYAAVSSPSASVLSAFGEEDATLYPALGDSSPVVALLAAHSRALQRRVQEMRARAESEQRWMDGAARDALQQLRADRSSLGESIPLLDEAAASAVAALPPGSDSLAQIHAMLAAAPRVNVGEVDVGEGDVLEGGGGGSEVEGESKVRAAAGASEIVEGAGEAGAALASVEEAVGSCMDLYFLADAQQTQFHIASQLLQQADREVELRQFMLAQLRALDDRREWWAVLNLTAEEASEKLKTMADGEDKTKLSDFLFWYLPFRSWFDSEGPDHPKAVAHVEQQRAELAAATSAAMAAEATLNATQVRLWEECGLHLPHGNWTEEQSALLQRYAAVANASGCTEQCVDWEAIYPEYESKPGLVAPKQVWQKLPEHYPDPKANLSFLLTYTGRADRVKPLVHRLYACTKGMRGEGALPGIRAELFVSVVDPDATLEAWMHMWNETDEGIFVVPVLPRLGADPLMLNDLARMARGRLLVLLHGDALPPADCRWLQDVLDAFAAWPRLALAGYRTDDMPVRRVDQVGKTAAAGESVRFWRGFAEERERGGGGSGGGKGVGDGGKVAWKDPESGVPMHFTGLVTGYPVVVRRAVLEEVGWLDEADDRQGHTAIMTDWHLCSRMWLSGYQVARLQLRVGEGDPGDLATIPRSQHRHALPGLGSHGEGNGRADYGEYDAALAEYHDDIVKEVARLNSLLLPND